MNTRSWLAVTVSFFAYMRGLGWGRRGTFMMRGAVFHVVGLPVIWQARDADNDNAVRT